MNKFTKLWDLYLLQALFTVQIKVYATLKYSSFYLLYKRHFYLSSDDNSSWFMKVFITLKEYENWIKKLHYVRIAVNELLLQWAIAAQRV